MKIILASQSTRRKELSTSKLYDKIKEYIR